MSVFQPCFGDLDGVGGRSLAQIVRYDPEIKAVRNALVAAETPDEYFVLFMRPDRHRIDRPAEVVLQTNAGSFPEDAPDFVEIVRPLELDIDGFAVPSDDRDADAGRRDPDRRVAQNLSRFILHFELLARIALLDEDVDLRQHVVRDRMRKLSLRIRFLRKFRFKLAQGALPA